MTPLQFGILGCILMLVLLMSSMPVSFVLALVGGLGFFAITQNPTAASAMMVNELHGVFGSHSLTVIPLFIFMGQIAFHSGISRRLFDAAYHWLGALPGGLAMATVGACTGFGAICGSGPATAATMAAVALPEMRRRGYDLELGTGAVAAAGSLGMLIPPSVVFIVYGIMTEQSPEQLFIAGILPGLLIALLFCITIYISCIRRPELGPAAERFGWKAKVVSLLGVTETLILFSMVIGGMFFGWFTPTEAAAAGAAGSLVIAMVKRQLTWRAFRRSLLETVRTSCMVMIIVAGALMFGRFLAITRIPSLLAETLAGLPLPGWTIMGVIIAFYLVAGCFVDALALILLTIPIFDPVVRTLGYDPVWFGVMIVVVTQMGVISPPVGVNVYVVSGIERDIPLQTVFKGALPFLGALIVSAAILVLFPEISLFLPTHGVAALRFLALALMGFVLGGGILWGVLRLLHHRVTFAAAFSAASAVLLLLAMAVGAGSKLPGAWGAVILGVLALPACCLLLKTMLRTAWIRGIAATAALVLSACALWMGFLAHMVPDGV